jgi:drug/metabolite transporter (DMT)-like permease
VAHLCSSLVNPRRLSSRRRGQLAVALAAIAWSTAGLFQRELDVSTATQLAGRAAFALVALLGLVWLTERGNVARAFRSIGIAGVGVAVCTAIASGSFMVALNHTTVAHVLFTQAISPVLAALLGWVVLREPVTGRTLAAMVIAVAGVAIMFGTPGTADVIGDGVSLLMSFAFAIAIVITRHRRDVSMIPAVCLSQMMVVCVAVPFAAPSTLTSHDLVFLVLIGAFQMGVGLALFAVGARLINAAEVALITLLEVVLGPLWVWIAFTETPDTATLVGGLVVLVAVIVQVSGEVRLPVRLSATEAAPPPP